MALKGALKKIRNQKAVWWSNTGRDQYGDDTFSEPVEIKCRWDDQIGEFEGPRAETLKTRAVVIVDRDMKVGDVLKLGALDSSTPEDSDDDTDAWAIQAFTKNPDLKAKEFVRKAFL